MRTSMRPRSAGSSRISKLLLPLLTEVAISTASPLSGTGAFVAAVAVSALADVAVGVLSCGWIVPAVAIVLSDASVAAFVAPATDPCSWADMAPVDVEAARAAASAVTVTAALASGLPVPAGCCTRPFSAAAVVESVAVGSVAAVSDAVVLDEVLGVTGAVAATAVVNAAAFTADTSAVVAGWLVEVAVVWAAAAVTAIFAVVVAVASVVVVGAAVAVVVAVGSVLTGADAAACAEMACELAAIAAAAIASGAVALPEVGVAAGVVVATMGTGSTTATGVGVVRDSPAC